LLTEAEYEYVTRAGTTTMFFFGDDSSALGQYAWYRSNSDRRTHPVGVKSPNDFGLYDIVGNVWGWVDDCYHATYEGAPTDGSAWIAGNCNARVVRGGSWEDDAVRLRSASRASFSSVGRNENLGFRVARTLLIP
jgi:formylglycine-generating enzyme required for sulfatase activity